MPPRIKDLRTPCRHGHVGFRRRHWHWDKQRGTEYLKTICDECERLAAAKRGARDRAAGIKRPSRVAIRLRRAEAAAA